MSHAGSHRRASARRGAGPRPRGPGDPATERRGLGFHSGEGRLPSRLAFRAGLSRLLRWANFNSTLVIVIVRARTSRRPAGAGPPSSSWRLEPTSPPTTWTIEEYTIGDLVSVWPYGSSFEPVGVAHGMTYHIAPLGTAARPVRTRQHRIKHDTPEFK